jgi:hypothetical protein
MTIDPAPRWQKSSFCSDRACLEVASLGDGIVAVRDNKNLDQPPLSFPRGGWISFLHGVAAGEFDAR